MRRASIGTLLTTKLDIFPTKNNWQPSRINSLALGEAVGIWKYNIYSHLVHWYRKYFLGWCSQVWATAPIDDKRMLVQVMAWCRQATSHYLNQCWPRSMSPYDVTKPRLINCLPRDCDFQFSHVLVHRVNKPLQNLVTDLNVKSQQQHIMFHITEAHIRPVMPNGLSLVTIMMEMTFTVSYGNNNKLSNTPTMHCAGQWPGNLMNCCATHTTHISPALLESMSTSLTGCCIQKPYISSLYYTLIIIWIWTKAQQIRPTEICIKKRRWDAVVSL